VVDFGRVDRGAFKVVPKDFDALSRLTAGEGLDTLLVAAPLTSSTFRLLLTSSWLLLLFAVLFTWGFEIGTTDGMVEVSFDSIFVGASPFGVVLTAPLGAPLAGVLAGVGFVIADTSRGVFGVLACFGCAALVLVPLGAGGLFAGRGVPARAFTVKLTKLLISTFRGVGVVFFGCGLAGPLGIALVPAFADGTVTGGEVDGFVGAGVTGRTPDTDSLTPKSETSNKLRGFFDVLGVLRLVLTLMVEAGAICASTPLSELESLSLSVSDPDDDDDDDDEVDDEDDDDDDDDDESESLSLSLLSSAFVFASFRVLVTGDVIAGVVVSS
jgi:hypothetical protein